MTHSWYTITKFCRWCNTTYKAKKRTQKEGFCCAGHKQAHYRAYKKWVTGKRSTAGQAAEKDIKKR